MVTNNLLSLLQMLWMEVGLYLFIESFRFWDKDDYEYEIFWVLSCALAWISDILAGKRDSRRHSTTSLSENVVVAGTS